MKKQIVVFAMLLTFLPAVKAFAGTANATASTTTQTQAQANGNSFNASLGLSASTGPSSADVSVGNFSTGASTSQVGNVSTGASTSNSQVGNVSTGASTSNVGSVSTGASTSQVGATSASVGGLQNNLSISSEAAKIPLGTPNAILPSIPTAQIFGDLSQRPAIVRGIPLILESLRQCNAVATKKYPLEDVFDAGKSGKTEVVFSPNQNYASKSSSSSSASASGASDWSANPANLSANTPSATSTSGASVRTAQVLFPTAAGAYDCLGTMTVSAKSGSRAPFTTVVSDARIYALDKMSGFPDIYLVSVPEAIAAAESLNTAGSGMGVSPGIVGSAANMLTGGMISAGIGSGKSNAAAGAEIGCTFFVLARAGNGPEVIIDPNKVSAQYAEPKAKPAVGDASGEKISKR